MPRYLLSIGSNCPQAASMMACAQQWLSRNFGSVVSSGVYGSKALNPASADYLNMVARVSSDLVPETMVARAKEFERRCGRTLQSKQKGCVEMDVDVVGVDNVILRPDEFARTYFMEGFRLIEHEK